MSVSEPGGMQLTAANVWSDVEHSVPVDPGDGQHFGAGANGGKGAHHSVGMYASADRLQESRRVSAAIVSAKGDHNQGDAHTFEMRPGKSRAADP